MATGMDVRHMPDVQPHRGQGLGVLVKPASADCNLRCEYCFYHERGNDPYAADGRRHVMSERVLDRFLEEFLPLAGPQPNFGWQGGEPTVAGVEFFERVIERQQRFKDRRQSIANALQTNALLLDEDWAQFLHEHRFLVGVSLDGPVELHDRYRYDYGDSGTFSRVMKKIDLLRRHAVEFNILCVVNRLTAAKAETIFKFFTENGFQWLQFIPAVERDEKGRLTPFSVTARQYGDFLCRVFDLWWQDGKPTVSVRMFDEVLGVAMGQVPGSCQLNEVCGGLYVVVEYNGDVYPCDFFVEDRWRMGNIVETSLEEMLRGEAVHRFTQLKPNASGKCQACRFRGICHNGCPHYRSLGDGTFLNLDYLCEGYYKFYSYALPKLARFRLGAPVHQPMHPRGTEDTGERLPPS